MNKIISKIITFEINELPPKTDFIENEIKKRGINPIRWAVVDIEKNKISISTSGYLTRV